VGDLIGLGFGPIPPATEADVLILVLCGWLPEKSRVKPVFIPVTIGNMMFLGMQDFDFAQA